MADAMLSAAAERLFGLFEEQARHHINLIRGAEEKVRSLAVDLQNIRNVLDDAENRRFKDKKINYWLYRLEQVASEIEDVVDEWDYFLVKHQIQERGSDDAATAPSKQKVCSFIPSSSSCLCFNKVAVRHNIGNKMLNVKAKLDEILKEREQYGFVISQPAVDPSSRVESTSMIDLTEVHGRDTDTDLLVAKLVDNGGSQQESGFRILSIVGTGGLGKTTLAQMVYNHSRVDKSFELRIWVCVSHPFDLPAIAKGILESIKVGSAPNTNKLEVLLKQVKEFVLGRKFLLVLDDVWTECSDEWEPLEKCLKCGGAGSKVLVTSRSERVVKMMGKGESEICRPGLLSDEDCWVLLCRMALTGRNGAEFEGIGKEIAKKCKGLPLAAKTLGSLLRFKSSIEQWNNVLNSKIWEIKEAEVDLFHHLLLSYNELSPTLKRCFSYCAYFPKDAWISVEGLIEKWTAVGYLGANVDGMELKGRDYFNILAMRSLFQDFEKLDSNEIEVCKMHDIVHDFAQFVKKSGREEATGLKKGTTCPICGSSHVSMVNDFCTLYVDEESQPLPKFCKCHARLRVLNIGVKSIPQGTENFIHLRQLFLSYTELSPEDLKAIFKLYNLCSLTMRYCGIAAIPKQIGNLIRLRQFTLIGIDNLSLEDLKSIFKLYHLQSLSLTDCNIEEIPKEIGNLIHLRFLDLSRNKLLKELPESICDLQKLETLVNDRCDSLCRIPERLLHKLSVYTCGIGGIKLGILKNLNKLRGCLKLQFILLGDVDLNEVVEDARKAELKNEIHITKLKLSFIDRMGEAGSSSLSWVWMDVMDALEPHPNLSKLEIQYYGGSKLPWWMVSPLNLLKNLSLCICRHLTSLPPFGKLPCLEEIKLWGIEGVEILGREFLGITAGEGDGGDVIAFPKLKTMEFRWNENWKVWEDISVEEEECVATLIMPCLTDLRILECNELSMLPHRLLRKVSSLKTLDITDSDMLEQRYCDKDGSDWKSISINNPALKLII